jgi:two-component system CheB/CheR fusion protein
MKKQAQDPAFERLLEYLKRHRGFDFTGYKRASLMRRVRRRMDQIDAEGFEAYRDYLEVHPEEFAYLFNTILINVTSFFRDREAWDYLADEVIPRIVADHPFEEGPIRVWSAGCAAGEEAYSLAILFAEALEGESVEERLKIYATDVDEEALAQARQAGYSPEAMEPVPAELRDKYFTHSSGRYVIKNGLRRAVVFGRHDLIQDAPISRLDLLVCRNTLIYLNAETQRRVLARFHFALNDAGFLFLGRAEMLLTHAHLFTPVKLKYRVFSKVPKVTPRDRMVVLTQAGDDGAADELGRYVRMREAVFEASPLAQVVLDPEGVVALVNQRAQALFDLRPDDVGRRFRDLELSYRPVELRSAVEQAQAERRVLTLEDVERPRPDDATQYLEISVIPLRENGDRPLGMCLTFRDVTRRHDLREELSRSNQELETAYEEVQSTNEELETTNEELQSTVEELQTTNEELQSSNEEMETMNEELRTTNETFQAKNDELRQRTEELNQVRLFLESILASVEVGVVVIDSDFQVLLWNEEAEDLWGLREEEVVGRSLLSLDIGLPVGELADPVRALLAGELDEDGQPDLVLDAVNRTGKAIEIQITNTLRAGPEGAIEGVVLVMDEKAQAAA